MFPLAKPSALVHCHGPQLLGLNPILPLSACALALLALAQFDTKIAPGTLLGGLQSTSAATTQSSG